MAAAVFDQLQAMERGRQPAGPSRGKEEQAASMPASVINQILARLDALEGGRSGEKRDEWPSERWDQASSSRRASWEARPPGESLGPEGSAAPVARPWGSLTPPKNTAWAPPAGFPELFPSSPSPPGEPVSPSQLPSGGPLHSREAPGPTRGGPLVSREASQEAGLEQEAGGQSGVLDEHLASATIEKILKGEYVDLFSLLYRELDKKEEEDLDAGEREKLENRRIDRSWSNWFIGYLIYMDVIVKAQPSRAHSLLVYLNTIFRAHTDFSGTGWLHYDERFRMRAAKQPRLRWDSIVPELWMQTLTPGRPVFGERSHSGHLVQFSKSRGPPRARGSQEQQQIQLCWKFGVQGFCARRPCKYKHLCGICRGPHSIRNCNKGRGGGTGLKDGGGKRGPGSQPPLHNGALSMASMGGL